MASRLSDLENVRNDLNVAYFTVACKRAALTLARGRSTRLQAEVSRLSSELALLRTQQEVADSYRQRLVDSTAEVHRLRALLVSLRDSVTDGLSRSNGQIFDLLIITSLLQSSWSSIYEPVRIFFVLTDSCRHFFVLHVLFLFVIG